MSSAAVLGQWKSLMEEFLQKAEECPPVELAFIQDPTELTVWCITINSPKFKEFMLEDRKFGGTCFFWSHKFLVYKESDVKEIKAKLSSLLKMLMSFFPDKVPWPLGPNL